MPSLRGDRHGAEFNDKGLELLLALPLPQSRLSARQAGWICGAGISASFFTPPEQTLLWTVSLICELWIVAAFSLLCVLTFNQIMTALSAVMAFYLLARSISALQLIGQGSLSENTLSQQALNFVIHAIAVLLPRLGEFTRTDWLVFHSGTWGALYSLLAQTAAYLALLTGAALFDLYRKNL